VDMLGGIKQNVKLNNKKGSNLIHSYNSFRIANILTAILSISLCITLFFSVPKATNSISEKVNSITSNVSENQSNTNSTFDEKVPMLSNISANQANSNQIQP
jgi:hypothetical protein